MLIIICDSWLTKRVGNWNVFAQYFYYWRNGDIWRSETLFHTSPTIYNMYVMTTAVLFHVYKSLVYIISYTDMFLILQELQLLLPKLSLYLDNWNSGIPPTVYYCPKLQLRKLFPLSPLFFRKQTKQSQLNLKCCWSTTRIRVVTVKLQVIQKLLTPDHAFQTHHVLRIITLQVTFSHMGSDCLHTVLEAFKSDGTIRDWENWRVHFCIVYSAELIRHCRFILLKIRFEVTHDSEGQHWTF